MIKFNFFNNKFHIIFFILFFVIILNNILWGDELYKESVLGNLSFLFDFRVFYRTCEMVEITGNEDTFNAILSPLIIYFNDGIFFESYFDINILSSNKSRFYEQFNPDLIRIKEIYFEIFFNNDFSFISGYFQNLILGYHFENYNPPVIYRTPAYPLPNYYLNYFDYKNVHPFFAFFLGDRFLPIYYGNSSHLFDLFFVISYKINLNNYNSLIINIGTSNGEEGLDSNSSKQFFIRIIFRNCFFNFFDFKNILISKNRTLKDLFFNKDENFNEKKLDGFYFSLAASIGERGSVPAKVRNDQFSFYFEYLSISKNLSFNLSFEFYLTFHGFTKDKINPYDPSFNNFVFDQNDSNYYSFWNLYLYNYNDGFLLPDDLPNYDKFGEILIGGGGFVYLSIVFNSKLKIFSSFSLYDSNIKSNYYIIYKPKYKFLTGIEIKIGSGLYFNFTFIYGIDEVYNNYVQFYEAESRLDHKILNYDLFFSIIFSF